MIRMLFARIAELMRSLRHFLFGMTKPFLPITVIASYEVNRATQLTSRGEHDEAIAILDQLVITCPGMYPLYWMRGSIHYLKMRFDRALADLNEAIGIDPDAGNSYLLRGVTWASLREYERAVDDFNTAIGLDPKVDDFNTAIGLDPTIEAYSSRGDAFMEMGKYIAAMDDYEKVIDLRPDAAAYEARGTAYLRLEMYDDALSDFNTATRLDPSKAGPYVKRFDLYLRQKDHEAAAESCTKVIELYPEDLDIDGTAWNADAKSQLLAMAVMDIGHAYCGRGISRSRAGDFEGALSDFSVAIRILPENPRFYLARAIAHAEQGVHKEAMRDIETASKLGDRNANAYCTMAWVYYEGGDFEKAVQSCRRAIGLIPHWADPYCLSGLARMRLGDHQDAIEEFAKAIEIGPGQPRAEDAQSYGFSMELRFSRPAMYAYRGIAHILMGDESKGREDIREAAELGLALSEIKEDPVDLLPNRADREAIEDLVTSAIEVVRTGREARVGGKAYGERSSGSRRKSSASVSDPASGEMMTLSRKAYTGLFQQLGFHDIRSGRILKHDEPIPSIYFTSSRNGVVYFVAYVKDRERFGPDLWRRVPQRNRRFDRDNLMTIVPRGGRERRAFEQLLAGAASKVSSLPEQSTPRLARRVMVNDYRGRNPKDTVNGSPVSAVIHLGTCRFVPASPGDWWSQFNSLEAAQATYGIHAAMCAFCLKGEGRHLDRVQPA